MSHEPQESYDGPASVLVDGAEHPVAVTLRGAFQPVDGLFHWYGRITDPAPLPGVRSGAAVTLRTAVGEAPAKLSDEDPWGRLRVTGTGRPPF